jgi:hypothetical protein
MTAVLKPAAATTSFAVAETSSCAGKLADAVASARRTLSAGAWPARCWARSRSWSSRCHTRCARGAKDLRGPLHETVSSVESVFLDSSSGLYPLG